MLRKGATTSSSQPSAFVSIAMGSAKRGEFILSVSFNREKSKPFYSTACRHAGGRDVEWLETCLKHFGLMLASEIYHLKWTSVGCPVKNY